MAEPSACAYLDAVLDCRAAPDAGKAAAFLLNTADCRPPTPEAPTWPASVSPPAHTAGVLKLLAADQLASSSAGDLLEALRDTDDPRPSPSPPTAASSSPDDDATSSPPWIDAARWPDPRDGPPPSPTCRAGKKKGHRRPRRPRHEGKSGGESEPQEGRPRAVLVKLGCPRR